MPISARLIDRRGGVPISRGWRLKSGTGNTSEQTYLQGNEEYEIGEGRKRSKSKKKTKKTKKKKVCFFASGLENFGYQWGRMQLSQANKFNCLRIT